MPEAQEWYPTGGVHPAATPAVPRRPENSPEFRLGRLLILLDTIPRHKTMKPVHIERLGYYDFFSDNPFLIVDAEDPDRLALQLAGFSRRSLSYNSSSQRFANRRARLKHDLALLSSRALIEIATDGRHITFSPSGRGSEVAAAFTSLYAKSFLAAAQIVVKRLNRLSDKGLGESAREWLRAEPFLIDIYGHGEENA